jgi:hypothetical protein
MRTGQLVSLGVITLVAMTSCTRAPGRAAAADSASTALVPSGHPAAETTVASAVATVSPLGRRGPTTATDIHGDRPSATLDLVSDTGGGERATLARLEREARAIARTSGCSSAGACRTAPVGSRSCGGPRTYIVYCATSTDTVALRRKLRELERAEKAYNEKSGMMSTCEMRIAPATALVGGYCKERPRSLGGEVP